jgi:hypothetical protein
LRDLSITEQPFNKVFFCKAITTKYLNSLNYTNSFAKLSPEEGTTGWFIWAGKEFSQDPDRSY